MGLLDGVVQQVQQAQKTESASKRENIFRNSTIYTAFAGYAYVEPQMPQFDPSAGVTASIPGVPLSSGVKTWVLHKLQVIKARAEETKRAQAEHNQLLAEFTARMAEAEERLSDAMAEVPKRFPDHEFPLIPDWIAVEFPGDQNNEHRDFWALILEWYPSPPRSEKERKEREAQFWVKYASRFSEQSGGGDFYLIPKQNIMDYFRFFEKWIYREYFAATGVVQRTFWGRKYINLLTNYQAAYRNYKNMAGITGRYESNPRNNQIESTYQEAERRYFDYLDQGDAHMDRGGDWFFNHIEQAFNRLIEEKQPIEPAYGDARPADLMEALTAAKGKAGRNSVHDQEF